MPWFKVDDSFHAHPKVLASTPAAVGLWVIAGSWAASHPDNGFIPLHVLPRLCPEGWEELAAELVTRKLWLRVRAGYRFRDWDHYQPTKEDVQKSRAAARERQRKRRAKLNSSEPSPQVIPDAVTDMSQRDSRSDTAVSHATPSLPDPTRPVLKEVSSSGGDVADINARGSRLPESWTPSRKDVEWARENFPDVDSKAETEKFRDHWAAEPGAKGRKSDWHATWRNWIRKASEFRRGPKTARVSSGGGNGHGPMWEGF